MKLKPQGQLKADGMLKMTANISALIIASTLMLTACSSTDAQFLTKAIQNKDPSQIIENYKDYKVEQYKNNPELLISDAKQLIKLFDQLKKNAGKEWGEEKPELPSRKKYVKYTQNYQSRAMVDFDKGTVTVETIQQKDALNALKNAVVTTLLTTEDPAATDIFSDKTPTFNGEPYLYQQVYDHEGKSIRYQWRAERFAEYLVSNKLQKTKTSKGINYSVNFDLVEQHSHLRQQKYSEHVLASAKKYGVSPTLIYAIIETESSFNPFAVSRANAYGLMQVVPTTAGKDVYTRIKKRTDQPTQKVLFSPQQNIDIGTAYLHILNDIYLKKITNKQSREYSMISAYNGGAGNVFKTFSNNRQDAPEAINRLSPASVYKKLTERHPRQESRRYIEKVTTYQKKYE